MTSAMQLGVYPMEACVKVGDTLVDISEGLNAGMWTVGVTKTGNELGLPLREVKTILPNELTPRLQAASRRMLQAGAHYFVEEVAQLPAVIEAIRDQLTRGERP